MKRRAATPQIKLEHMCVWSKLYRYYITWTPVSRANCMRLYNPVQSLPGAEKK